MNNFMDYNNIIIYSVYTMYTDTEYWHNLTVCEQKLKRGFFFFDIFS